MIGSVTDLGAVNNPAISLNLIEMGMGTPPAANDTVTLTISDTTGIQDIAGNKLETIPSFTLVNTVASNPGAPGLSAASVRGDKLVLTYDKPMLPNRPPDDAFTVTVTPSTTTTVTDLIVMNDHSATTATVVLTLSAAVQSTDTVTLSYNTADDYAPRLQSMWERQVAALTNQTVTNDTGKPEASIFRDHSAVTEGNTASFTVTLLPAPAGNVDVNLTITQMGDFVADTELGGMKTVTVTPSGTEQYTVDTVGDSTDEANGAVIATLETGTDYVVHPMYSAAGVAVNDNDGSSRGGGGGGGRGGGGGGRGGSGGSDRHGNSVATATPIAFRPASPRAGSIAGTINTRSDVDYFRLRLAQAGVLVIETNGSTDTRGQAWQAGEELSAATDGGPGSNFRLATPVEAGDVVIAIAGEGGRTGVYTLRARLMVSHLENPSPTSFQSGLGAAGALRRRGGESRREYAGRRGAATARPARDSGGRPPPPARQAGGGV